MKRRDPEEKKVSVLGLVFRFFLSCEYYDGVGLNFYCNFFGVLIHATGQVPVAITLKKKKEVVKIIMLQASDLEKKDWV